MDWLSIKSPKMGIVLWGNTVYAPDSFKRTPLPTMTDDPNWRTLLIVLTILSALFAALLLLVGFNQRGQGAVPARGGRFSMLEETLRSVRGSDYADRHTVAGVRASACSNAGRR